MSLRFGKLITSVSDLPPLNSRHHMVVMFDDSNADLPQRLWMSTSNGNWQYCNPQEWTAAAFLRHDSRLFSQGEQSLFLSQKVVVDVSLLAGEALIEYEQAAALPKDSIAVFNHFVYGYRLMQKTENNEWWDIEGNITDKSFFKTTNEQLVHRLGGRVVWVPPTA